MERQSYKGQDLGLIGPFSMRGGAVDVAQAGKTPEVEGWYWHDSGFSGLFLVQMMDPEPRHGQLPKLGGGICCQTQPNSLGEQPPLFQGF